MAEIFATVFCPALFLAAPASGQGKTTVTAALARLLTRQGKVVRIFKTGPDYLDPQILQQASCQPVVQLDLWMAGKSWCQQQLYEAAKVADLILVEGAMGIFDGEPSSADLAACFNIPIVIVMDVKGMAQTVAAVASGIAQYRDDISIAGLIANNCGSKRHRQLIEEALSDSTPLLATLQRSEEVTLPERHLGLVQALEVKDELEKRFEAGANWLEAVGVGGICSKVKSIEFVAIGTMPVKPTLTGYTIGIAKDEAFTFIYDANVSLLEEMGAEVIYFSPLQDTALPRVDALWFPGGYPELHAEKLSHNISMIHVVKDFHARSKPILAECGGFLYCMETLTDLEGDEYPMVGIMPGFGAMKGKRGCQGMQTAPLPEGEVKAHAHHRSCSEGTPEPIGYGKRQRHATPGEAIYRVNNLTASYLHLFFPSNPDAIAGIFSAERANTERNKNAC